MEFITDRTSDDVTFAKLLRSKVASGSASEAERVMWNEGKLKGMYGESDMNRVEHACLEFWERLSRLGYGVGGIDAKTWQVADIPTIEDFKRYLANVGKCSAFFPIGQSLPSEVGFDFESANRIERILSSLDGVIAFIEGTVDAAWVGGLSYTGIYARSGQSGPVDKLYLVTEEGTFIADEHMSLMDMRGLSTGDVTEGLIVVYDGGTFKTEVKR